MARNFFIPLSIKQEIAHIILFHLYAESFQSYHKLTAKVLHPQLSQLSKLFTNENTESEDEIRRSHLGAQGQSKYLRGLINISKRDQASYANRKKRNPLAACTSGLFRYPYLPWRRRKTTTNP